MTPTRPSSPHPGRLLLACEEREPLATCSLVLSAMRIPHQVRPIGQGGELWVDADYLQEAQEELSTFFAENHGWPPAPLPSPEHSAPFAHPPTLLVIGGLLLLYGVTGPWTAHSPWFEVGAGDSQAILIDQQWWRLVTSLTLHADATHLLGNCAIGSLLVHSFCRLTGNGLGLFALFLTAMGATLLNCWAHGAGHRFVGFSTALFAVIGMLSSFNSLQQRGSAGYPRIMPLMAGLALLAFLGSSGEHTDLGAHLFGLLCGLPVGLLLGQKSVLRAARSLSLQSALFFLTTLLIGGSWWLAWQQPVHALFP